MLNILTKFARYIVRQEITSLYIELESTRDSRDFYAEQARVANQERTQYKSQYFASQSELQTVRSTNNKLQRAQKQQTSMTLHANQMIRLLARLDSNDGDIQNEVLRAYRETVRSELEKQLAAKPQTD